MVVASVRVDMKLTGGEEMKNMKKLVIVVSAFAVVLASCGKGEYKPMTTLPTSDTSAAAPAVDPISNFTTVWASEASSPALNPVHLRTLASFLGFSTSHYAIMGNQKYGFKSETTPSGPFYGPSDPMRNYFSASKNYYEVFPAPKDLGTVSYYKIRFAANVNDNTRKIIPGKAYLDVNVTASNGSFNVKFADVKSDLQVTLDVVCDNNTPADTTDDFDCDKIAITFADDCGDLAFKSDVHNGELVNPVVTFLNNAASYKSAGCYSGNKLPSKEIKYNNSISGTVPEGIHSNSGMGELFQTADATAAIPAITHTDAFGNVIVLVPAVPAIPAYDGIPTFVEQL
jgi:hypothetical protein